MHTFLQHIFRYFARAIVKKQEHYSHTGKHSYWFYACSMCLFVCVSVFLRKICYNHAVFFTEHGKKLHPHTNIRGVVFFSFFLFFNKKKIRELGYCLLGMGQRKREQKIKNLTWTPHWCVELFMFRHWLRISFVLSHPPHSRSLTSHQSLFRAWEHKWWMDNRKYSKNRHKTWSEVSKLRITYDSL